MAVPAPTADMPAADTPVELEVAELSALGQRSVFVRDHFLGDGLG